MNISNIRVSSEDFHILQTTARVQTATMTLQPGAATSEKLESHPDSDQVVLVLEGTLLARIDDEQVELGPSDCLIIPAGTGHRLCNTSNARVFAFTVYVPPAYTADGTELTEGTD